MLPHYSLQNFLYFFEILAYQKIKLWQLILKNSDVKFLLFFKSNCQNQILIFN